jgi:hypothetical protein
LGRQWTKSAYGKTLTYSYYPNGQRQRLTYPEGGFYVDYAYNNAGELRTITDNVGNVLATYGYDAQAALSGLTRLNSASTVYGPDAIKRLHTLTHAATGLNQQSVFEYNPAGQITKKSVNSDAAYVWTPTTPNSTAISQVNGQNQLTNFAGTTVTDDANGNVTTGLNNLTYSFDALNQLSLVTGGSDVVSVKYDPTGMLHRITVGATHTDYLYDGADLVAQYDTSGNLIRRFVHGAGVDEPLVVYDAATATNTWLHADERGSIVASTNASGALVSSVKYSAEGEASGALVSPFGYTGQLYLPQLQLY